MNEPVKTHYPGGGKIYPERRTKEELREKDRKRYRENKERELARKKEWNQANAEKLRAYKKEYNSRPEVVQRNKERRLAYRLAHREQEAAKQKEWYAANRDKVLAHAKEYASSKAEQIKERAKVYREKTKEKRAKWFKAWHEKNKEYRAQYARDRIAKDPAAYYARIKELKKKNVPLTIAERIRGRIRGGLKRAMAKKSMKTVDILGCTFTELMAHLELLFKPGMTWENYGIAGWEIDHKRPCASFDLRDEAQQRQCFHYTNLQPLWQSENRRKSDAYVPDVEIAV